MAQSNEEPIEAAPNTMFTNDGKGSVFNPALVVQSLECGLTRDNYLVQYLSQLFGQESSYELVERFQIGTVSICQGATVFWRIDYQQKVRTGKILLVDPQTGKSHSGSQYQPADMHNALKIADFRPVPCLFGEHQLRNRLQATVAIVESEITAIIASKLYPEFIWLATGSSGKLNSTTCSVLDNRNVVLFPKLSKDGQVFEAWTRTASEIGRSYNCRVSVSRYLEDNASAWERAGGLDIGDFLIQSLNLKNGTSATQQEECLAKVAYDHQSLSSLNSDERSHSALV